jgi:hypothetical protein
MELYNAMHNGFRHVQWGKMERAPNMEPGSGSVSGRGHDQDGYLPAKLGWWIMNLAKSFMRALQTRIIQGRVEADGSSRLEISHTRQAEVSAND